MGSVRSSALGMLVLLSSTIWASATDYTVGDSSGWTTGVDYMTWSSDQSFQVGDNLVFNFVSGAHTVTEVTQSDYQSCSSANAINNNNAPTKVSLTSTGTRYFICGVPGHCSSGQKLAVSVGGSASGGSSAGSTTTSPTYTETDSSANPVLVGTNVVIVTGLVMLKLAFSWAY